MVVVYPQQQPIPALIARPVIIRQLKPGEPQTSNLKLQTSKFPLLADLYQNPIRIFRM